MSVLGHRGSSSYSENPVQDFFGCIAIVSVCLGLFIGIPTWILYWLLAG